MFQTNNEDLISRLSRFQDENTQFCNQSDSSQSEDASLRIAFLFPRALAVECWLSDCTEEIESAKRKVQR